MENTVFEITEKLESLIIYASKNLEVGSQIEKTTILDVVNELKSNRTIHSNELLCVYSVVVKKLRTIVENEFRRSTFGFNIPNLYSLFHPKSANDGSLDMIG